MICSSFTRLITLLFSGWRFANANNDSNNELTWQHLKLRPRFQWPIWLVAWHSGKMLVCDRRTFPVIRSTCSWRVTTYVGKPSAARSANKANSAFHPLEVDKWIVSCNRMCATSLGWRHLVNVYGLRSKGRMVRSIHG